MISDPDQVIEPGTCALLRCGTWRALPLSSIGRRIRPKSVGTTHPRCDLGSDGTTLVAGVPMERGVRFSRGQLHSGIDGVWNLFPGSRNFAVFRLVVPQSKL